MAIKRVPPGSQSSLREANRARILETIRKQGAMTQVELADATGLSPATVSIIVTELATAGIVSTHQVTRSGRRAIQVSMSRRLGLTAGIHFSTRSLRIVLMDPLGTIVAEQRMPLAADHRHDTDMDRATELVLDMMQTLGAGYDELVGAGVGVAAPYDAATDQISVPGLVRGWDEVHVVASMSRRLGKPVVADNDANLAMLGEWRYGIAQGLSSAVYVTIGHGVGAGILANGDILRGSAGASGEIGHIRVVENGALCRCGNRGCLEMMINSASIADALPASLGNVTLRDVIAMARQGDLGCTRVIADAAGYLGIALASLYNVINPEMIVIGGELADAGPLLSVPLESVIERHSLHNPLYPPRVEFSELGTNASAIGAAAYAFDSVPLELSAIQDTA